MELPPEIRNILQEKCQGVSLNELKKISQRLSKQYLADDREESSLCASKSEVLAYANMRLPATYSALGNALEYSLEINHPDIHSLLDIGAGIGTASIAAFNLFPKLEKIDAYEKEKEMMALGRELTKNLPITWHESDVTESNLFPHADFIIVSYALNEIEKTKRLTLISALWEKADQWLLIVEPGTPKCYEEMKTVRDFLLKNNAYLVAPCPHMDTCRMQAPDWCHFVTRLSRSKIQKILKDAEAPYEDEKYTYLCFSKTPVSHPSYQRMIRKPIIHGNDITSYVCDEIGVRAVSITKKDKEKFRQMKKLESGGKLNA